MEEHILKELAEIQWSRIQKLMIAEPLHKCRRVLRDDFSITLDNEQALKLYEIALSENRYSLNVFLRKLKKEWRLFDMADKKIKKVEAKKVADYILTNYKIKA